MIGGEAHNRRGRALLAGVVLLAAGPLALLPCRGQGTPIQFSRPDDISVFTNLSTLPPESPDAKRLQQELLKGADPGSSLLKPQDPIFSRRRNNYRPPPAPALTEKEKQTLDRKRNWVFVLPGDETEAQPSVEKAIGAPEYDEHGQPKKTQTVLEKFMESLSAPAPIAGEAFKDLEKSDSLVIENAKPEGRDAREPGLPGGVLESLTSTPSGLDLLSRGTLGAADEPLWRRYAPEQAPSPLSRSSAQELRLREFRDLLEPRPASPLGADVVKSPSAAGTAGLLPSLGSLVARDPVPLPGPFTQPTPSALMPAPAYKPPTPLGGRDPFASLSPSLPEPAPRSSQPFLPVVPQRKF